MNTVNNRTALLLIFLFALLLRMWGVGDPPYFVGDEYQFIPATGNFLENGLYAPVLWLHPPLNFHVTALGIKAFGNTPYGWRMPNVLFGSLSVLMLMLLALRLFEDRRVAWLAGLFLAIEPFHIMLSRTNFMEIQPVLFFLLYAYAITLYVQGNERALSWSGLPLGLALAGKWYFVLPALAVSAYLLYRLWAKKDSPDRLLNTAYLASSGVTAAGVYLLLLYPWFKRGSSLQDLLVWQMDAYEKLQSIDLNFFLDGFFRSSPSVPWQWFVKPLIYGGPIFADAGWAKYFAFMNNPPVWLMTIPAVLFALRYLLKRNHDGLLLVVILFASTYLQFLLVRRPVFLYSSFPVLPFAYLLIAHAFSTLTATGRRGRTVFFFVFFATLLWGLYLYPVVTGRMVPTFLYNILLPLAQSTL